MLALPISKSRFKALSFYQNAKFLSAGDSAPDPRASNGGWGLRPKTPISLWQLGALPPDPQISPPPLRISGYSPEYLR